MRKRLFLFLLPLVIVGGIFTCCTQRINLAQQVQNALLAEPIENLHITVYYLAPWVCTRAPLTLERLICLDSEDLFIYHLDGEEVSTSVQAIKELLQENVIRPISPSAQMDARVYYVLENNAGTHILELIAHGGQESVYCNGTEVENDAAFYQIIKPCVGDNADDLWRYFHTVIEPPQFGSKPCEYPNTAWSCDDPAITFRILEDRSIKFEMADPYALLPADAKLVFFYDNIMSICAYDAAAQEALEYFKCRCVFSPTEFTATVIKDEIYEGQYLGKTIVFYCSPNSVDST